VQVRFRGLRRCAVHVLEELVGLGAGNTATLVRDLYADVLLALANGHLQRRQCVVVVMAMVLHNRTHGVLEELEKHVVQVRGHVHCADGQVVARLAAVLLDLQRRTGQVVLIAQEAGVLVGIANHIRQITGGIQTPNVAATRMRISSKEQGFKRR